MIVDIYAIVLTWLIDNMPTWLRIIITIILGIEIICKAISLGDEL